MKTLLIVDDQRTNLEILLGLLGEEYDILVALDGEEALEIVAQEPIDLLLLDIEMPGMDGFELCRRLREEPRTRETPVIFITAHTDDLYIERVYEVGGNDYVNKPFRPVEIRKRIEKELRLRSLERRVAEVSNGV